MNLNATITTIYCVAIVFPMMKKPLLVKTYRYTPDKTDPVIVDKFMQYLMRRIKKLNPNDPPQSLDVLRANVLEQHPHRQNIRIIAYAPELDIVVGSAQVAYETELSPSYEQNKHTCYAGAAVEEEHRNRGVAKALLKEVVKILKELGKPVIYSDVGEESGHEMIKKLGFAEIAMESAENRLYLKNVDWDRMNQWVKEGPKRSPTTKMTSFIEVPDDLLERFTKFHTTAMNTIPKEGMELEGIFTPESRRIEEEKYHKMGSIWRTLMTVEEDGEISGLTELIYNEKEPHYALQELTAVLPKYRGRGLGKWLKASMLLYMHETYPAIEYIITGNADVNAPMLAINEKMGYRRYRGVIVYKFKPEDLVKKFLTD